jgi:hypothetical protein
MTMIELLAGSRGTPPPAAFIVFGVAITIAILITKQKHRSMVLRCEEIAQRLKGQHSDGGLFATHQIRFKALECWHELDLQDGKHPHTHLRVTLPGTVGGWLKINPNSLGQFFVNLFEGPRFRTGDETFDDAFVVRSWPEHIPRTLFGAGRKSQAMAAILRLPSSRFSIQVSGSTLEIRVSSLGDGPDLALVMARTSEDLIRLLFDRPADAGIQWIESRERMSGLCPICTTALREPLVRCPRCRSPHHRECWDYLGRCATYGCEPVAGRRSA